MTTKNYRITLSDIREKLEWVSIYSLEIDKRPEFRTRLEALDAMLGNIEANISNNRLLVDMDSGDLFFPFHEILVLFDMFKYFERLPDSTILKKLIKSILKENADPRIDQENAHGRDHQFEILVAILLSKARWRIDGYEDVEAVSRDGIKVCFQCKRPREGENVIRNLNRGINQLIQKNDIGIGKYGVVAINLDLVYKSNIKSYFNTPDRVIFNDMRRIEKMFNEICTPVINSRENRGLIGAIGFLSFMKWSSKEGQLKFMTQTFPCPRSTSTFAIGIMASIQKSLSGLKEFGAQ